MLEIRACPGQDMAEASLWIIVAVTLASFNITRAKDRNGMEIIPPVEYTSRSFRQVSNLSFVH